MARVVKSLQRKVDRTVGHGYAHRDHRSKKNRRKRNLLIKDFKRRKLMLQLRELETNIV